MVKPKVSLIRCGSYETAEVEAAVKRSVDLLGGIEAFVRPHEKVLLKPNLLTVAAPDEGVDTHPEVVRAVIRLLKPVTRHITCGDSPSVWGERQDVDRVYDASGVREVCRQEGVDMVYFAAPRMVKGYPVTERALACDRLINIPRFKTHGFTILTAGVKNLFGLVVGMHKMKIHRDHPRAEDLSRALIDIYEIRRPDLTVLDGVLAMEGQGPGSTGILRKMGLVAAADDALALDMILALIMGCLPTDIPTNREAIRRGLGQTDPSSIELSGERWEDFAARDFRLPKTSLLSAVPSWALDIAKQFLSLRPESDPQRCAVCGLCQKSCPAGAISLKENRVRIDYKKCLFCLCCQEICPHQAMDVKRSFLLRLLAGRRTGKRG